MPSINALTLKTVVTWSSRTRTFTIVTKNNMTIKIFLKFLPITSNRHSPSFQTTLFESIKISSKTELNCQVDQDGLDGHCLPQSLTLLYQTTEIALSAVPAKRVHIKWLLLQVCHFR